MHCLHTQIQLLTDNDFCYPLGDFFLAFNCHYHYCYSLYFAILSLQKKYIFRILYKKI